MAKNVIVVAGPNGSGKTTFAREYLRDSEVSEYISADAIAERLVSRPEDMDSVKIQAGRLFIKEIQELIAAGERFCCGGDACRKRVRANHLPIESEGYTVAIVFIFLKSPETCVARVRGIE